MLTAEKGRQGVDMSNRYSRQIIAFREEGQAAIEREVVTIVGLGGLGSQLAQALAYLGVKQFTLIDADRVEDTNLNRLIGGYPEDAESNDLKVEVIKRHIERINPRAAVNTIPNDLRTEGAFRAIRHATTLFGCVDNDSARLILTEVAAAYTIPYIDTATDFELNEEQTAVISFGGRVVIARPGDFCLFCAGELDEEEAEAGLKPDAVTRIRRQHGYGRGNVTSASVVTLNGVLANVAAVEFMVMVTKLRDPVRKRVYKGLDGGVMLRNDDPPDPQCYTCKALVGVGDAANLTRYLQTKTAAENNDNDQEHDGSLYKGTGSRK